MKKKIILFISILFISFLLGLILVYNFKKQYSKDLKNYTVNETKHFISTFIKEIVDDVTEDVDSDKIFLIIRNNYNEIEMIDFNTIEVNKVLEKITKNIETNLNLLKLGKIKSVPLNNQFKGKNYTPIKKGLLFDLGDDFFNEKYIISNNTKVPIRLSFVGNVYTSISTNIKNYGYNSAYLEVDVVVEVKESVKLPTSSFTYKIKQSYPIALKIIQGSIPSYYNDISSNSNSYSLPIKK